MTAKTLLATFAAVTTVMLTLASTTPTAFAQEKLTAGKKGQIHLTVKVKAGSVVLEPGMYQVGHALDGNEHFVSFNEVKMPAGYRHGNTQLARDASARIPC